MQFTEDARAQRQKGLEELGDKHPGKRILSLCGSLLPFSPFAKLLLVQTFFTQLR